MRAYGRAPGDRVGVDVAREILRRVFAGVGVSPAVELEDGTSLFAPSDGPSASIVVVRHPGVLKTIFSRSSDLAVGEAVMRGDVSVRGSVEEAMASMDAAAAVRTPKEWFEIVRMAARIPAPAPVDRSSGARGPAKLRGRLHSVERDRAAIAYHYDVSNDFFALWLDENMIYSCAYFRHESDTLDLAQAQKCDLICRKLRLKRGERLLDIGCGWGGLVRFAAREYGARAVGVTLSRRQAEYAHERIEREGLQELCRVELLDYRELESLGRFDKIASVGMVEHVGDAMMPTYFKAAYRALVSGGLFLNHGIISNQARPRGVRALTERFFPHRSRFTESYVFPDGEMPRLAQMSDAALESGFEIRDVENLREHYTLTLRHWLRRLEAGEDRARQTVGDATYNVWRFWLAGSARSFAVGRLGVVQMLLAKNGPDGRAGIPATREDLYR